MKANELRIGNIVIRQGKLLIVKGCDINWFENGSYIGFEPIPLTEEWLLKFGFEKDNKWKSLYHKNGLSVWWYIERQSVMLHQCKPHNLNYYYVHQLQNLYFALTGEELTIKE